MITVFKRAQSCSTGTYSVCAENFFNIYMKLHTHMTNSFSIDSMLWLCLHYVNQSKWWSKDMFCTPAGDLAWEQNSVLLCHFLPGLAVPFKQSLPNGIKFGPLSTL